MAESVGISVIVPMYNSASYLGVLLESLLAQSFRDLEIIVVDDGSTDESVAIVESFAHHDQRIRLLRQANAGVSCARNAGLETARGQWITFADADDWLAPETYATWFAQAEANGVELLIGASFRFAGAAPVAAPLSEMNTGTSKVVDGRTWIRDAVHTRSWAHFVYLQLIHRDLLLKLRPRFIEGIVHEDVLWTAALMLGATRIGACARPFYGYRMTPGSLSGTSSPTIVRRRALSYFAVIDGLIEMADSLRDDPETAAALRRQASREARHLFVVISVDSRKGDRRQLAANFIARRYPRLIADHGYGSPLRRVWHGLRAAVQLDWIARRERWQKETESASSNTHTK